MTAAASTRAARAEVAARLRARGLNATEIAARMGISRSYVGSLITDPTGEQERRRKDSYRRPCRNCGTLLNGSDGPTRLDHRTGLCRTCVHDEQRIWTRDEIINTFQWFHATVGRPPGAADRGTLTAPSLRADASPEYLQELDAIADIVRDLPTHGAVTAQFGSWPAALDAAGLPRPRTGGAAHRGRRPGVGHGGMLTARRRQTLALATKHGGRFTLRELVAHRANTTGSTIPRAASRHLQLLIRYGYITRVDRGTYQIVNGHDRLTPA